MVGVSGENGYILLSYKFFFFLNRTPSSLSAVFLLIYLPRFLRDLSLNILFYFFFSFSDFHIPFFVALFLLFQIQCFFSIFFSTRIFFCYIILNERNSTYLSEYSLFSLFEITSSVSSVFFYHIFQEKCSCKWFILMNLQRANKL